MVRKSFQTIEIAYSQIRQSACGRQSCTVMIMVAYEVDAMASCRMLTHLLRSDHITYQICPVLNIEELEYTYKNFITTDIKTIFLLNCGATYNIPKLFGLESGGEVRCFIIDNHRPIHLSNIHSRHNVVAFDDESNIQMDEAFIPDDGSDLSDAEEDSSDEEQEEMDDVDDEGDGDEEEREEIIKKEDIQNAFGEEEEFEEVDGDADNEDDGAANDDDNDSGGGDGDDAAAAEKDDEEDPDKTVPIIQASTDSTADESERSVNPEGERKVGKKAKRRESVGTDEMDVTRVENWKSGEGLEEEEDADITRNLDQDSEADEASHEGEEDEEDKHSGTKKKSSSKIARSRDDDEGDTIEDLDEVDDEEKGDEEEDIKITGRRKSAPIDHKKLRREKLRAYYHNNSWNTAPTAIMLIHLLSNVQAGRLSQEMLWQAALGVTDMYLRGAVSEYDYAGYCDSLRVLLGNTVQDARERNRYQVPIEEAKASEADVVARNGELRENAVIVPGSESGHVEYFEDYRFFMYRHWSLLDSMLHSPYFAAKLTVWQTQGSARLQEMLARVGLPLQQCRQSYTFMNTDLRAHLKEQMKNENIQQMYNMRDPNVFFQSFVKYNSFKNPIAVGDVVYSATSLIEMYGYEELMSESEGGSGPSRKGQIGSLQAFNEGYDCLGMAADELMRKGIQGSLSLQRTIVKKASALLDGRDGLKKLSRIYFTFIRKSAFSSNAGRGLSNAAGLSHRKVAEEFNEVEHPFGRPAVLLRLGQFILTAKRNLSRKEGGWVGSALLPLVLLSERQDGQSFLVVGISPLNGGVLAPSQEQAASKGEEERLSPLVNFKQFFRLAAKDINIDVRTHSFDCCVTEVAAADAQDFLGTLDYLLKKATPNYMRAVSTAT